MLGTDLMEVLTAHGINARGVDRATLDITDADGAAAIDVTADVVVNCAAYTAVDAAETDEAAAYAVNAIGAANMAHLATRLGARLVHISTDYVFAGDAATPYAEDASTDPRSAYGRTKAAGEVLIRDSDADAVIVRTAWLYGAHGPCFPKTIASLAASRDALAVVDDQRGQPTWTRDLAEFIVRLVAAEAPAGIYHGTSDGDCTWFDFAREIVAAAQLHTIVTATTSDAFPRPAPRPAYSVLGHGRASALGTAAIPFWRDRWRVAASSVLSTP